MAKKAGQKRKREEKAKTQLKKSKTGPGQHLPKGTNVTRAEVKVGKIVIPNQVQDTDITKKDGPVTKRNLGVEDLLGKLSHFSQSVKTDALEGLKELLTGEFGGNLVRDKLSLLVNKILPLCSDQERKIRKFSLDILQAVLSQVDCLKLEPLYPVLTAHLSCCLTNIQPAIQRDALPLLDTLVVTAPHLVKSNFSRILPDCLRQISMHSSQVISSKDGKRTTAVSSQVTDKISSLEWRSNVLRRVDSILGCVSDQSNLQQEQNQKKQVSVKFTGGPLYAGLYCNGDSNDHLTKLDLAKKSSTDPIFDIIDRIVPLMLDSWVEVQGKEDKKSGCRSGFLQNDVYPLFSSITGILDKLVNLSEVYRNSNILLHIKSKYFSELKYRLFCHLPYSSHQGRCENENLKLSSTILTLAADDLDSLDLDLFNKINNIIKSCKSQGSLEELKVYEKILCRPDSTNLTPERRKLITEQLVERTCSMKDVNEDWCRWQHLVARLAADQHHGHLAHTWINRLPDLLVMTTQESERVKLLTIMLELAQTRNKYLLQAYSSASAKIQEWSRELSDSEDAKQLVFFLHQNIVTPVPS